MCVISYTDEQQHAKESGQEACLFKAKEGRLLAHFVSDEGLQLGPGVGLMGGAVGVEDLTQY